MLAFRRYNAPRFLTWILLILTTTTELYLATTSKSITADSCPTGFQLSNTHDQEPFCYQVQIPERFNHKFVNCPGNLYSYSSLRLIEHDNVPKSDSIWADFKSLYPGGPIVDWPYKENNYVISNSQNLSYILNFRGVIDETLCVATADLSYEKFSVFACDEDTLHPRYCILEPHEKMSKKGCEDLKDYYRFWTTCLRTVGAAGDAVAYNWTEAEKFCKKTGGTILNEGWIYIPSLLSAYQEPFAYEKVPKFPIDMDRGYVQGQHVGCECWEYRKYGTSTSCVLGVQNGYLTWFDNNTTFSNVICERPIALKNTTMVVSVNKQTEIIILTINDSVDKKHIYCYTDSVFHSSILRPVQIPNKDLGSNSYYAVKPIGDGYYWCINTDTENFYMRESNKALFINDTKALLNVYAVTLRIDTLGSENWNMSDWQRYLEYSYSKQFRNTALLHVKLYHEIDWITPLEILFLELLEDRNLNDQLTDITVLSGATVYYCKGFDSVPTLPLGASHLTTTYSRNYTCRGDFNDGVSWSSQTVTGCAKLEHVLEGLELLLQNETLHLTVAIIEEYLDQVDSLLQIEEEVEIPGHLLNTLDRLGSRIDLDGSAQGATIRENFALLIADSRPMAPVRGLRIATVAGDVFTADSFEIISAEVESSQLTTEESEAVVYLPESVVSYSRRISFVVFRNARAFSNHGSYVVNSIVMSINIENLTKFEQGEVIDIHLKPLIDHPERNQSRVCAYWKINDNDTGYWSQEGCTFIRSYQRGTLDICRCNHLTYFAEVLVNRELFTGQEERILEALTIAGCFLSIFGLFIVGLTAIIFESWRKEYANKIWLQLCISIFFMMVCFLVVVFTKFDSYDIPCTVLGIALHYAVLASFCWMLVAAILNYRKLVTVFRTKMTHFILKTSVFSWGAPCVVIAILLAVDLHSYAGSFEDKTPNGAFCYPSGLSKWLAVYAPISIILFANCTMYLLIMRSLFASKTIQRQRDEKEARRSVAVSCLLVFMFGLPWLFGLFAYNIVAAYFFTLSAAYQGFILFVFFVLINKKTRALWWNKLKIKRNRKVRTPVAPTLQNRVDRVGTAFVRQRFSENRMNETINDHVEERNVNIHEDESNINDYEEERNINDYEEERNINDYEEERNTNYYEVERNNNGYKEERNAGALSSDGPVASETSRDISNEETAKQRSFLFPAIEEVQKSLPKSRVEFWESENESYIGYQKMLVYDESRA